jgi:hypothetical protein
MKKANQASRKSQRRKTSKRVTTSATKNIVRKVWCRDLIELVLEPLSSRIDGARVELLDKIQVIEDSADIMAREISRQAKQA